MFNYLSFKPNFTSEITFESVWKRKKNSILLFGTVFFFLEYLVFYL